MPFINRLPVSDSDGRAVVVEAVPVAGNPFVAGIRYLPGDPDDTLYILTGAVPSDATFQDGFARDKTSGALCVLIDDPPDAADRVYNDGILGDAAGHMCLTTNAIAGYVHGWPVDAIGQVCITGGEPPPPGPGAELGITNFALYNHSAGSGLGTILTDSLEVASLAFTPGTHFTGGPYTGVGTPPLVGTIAAAAAPPSDVTATCTNAFAFIADVANIIDIDFNAHYEATGFPSTASVITTEVKLHDDTVPATVMDWFPDGAGGHMSGGTIVLDPTSMNRTIATASPVSGHFQCETPVLEAGHTYTLTVLLRVVDSAA